MSSARHVSPSIASGEYPVKAEAGKSAAKNNLSENELQQLRREVIDLRTALAKNQEETLKIKVDFARKNEQFLKSESLRNSLAAEKELLVLQLLDTHRKLQEIFNSRSWKLVRTVQGAYHLLTFQRKFCQEILPQLLHAPADMCERILKTPENLRKRAALEEFLRKQSQLVNTGYSSEFQSNENFGGEPSRVRSIAFYLPQYHTFPENDKWWGKGFTEWSNTAKSQPRFSGHYQPREPHEDIGYYDLADAETLRKQAALAAEHNIDIFCFYYYWFNGKTLMEKPLRLLQKHPDIPMNFCLCWANENWTRAWDGLNQEVLIAQNYSQKGNDLAFIRDIEKYLRDPRYLRVNGRPVLLVYRLADLPQPGDTIRYWKKYCKKQGIGELLVWSVRTVFTEADRERCEGMIDREVEFPPHRVASLEKLPPQQYGVEPDKGNFYNYSRLISDVVNHRTISDASPNPVYRCAMMGWDNSARRKDGWSVWINYTLSDYYVWLRHNLAYTCKQFPENERFVFINAWNEWAEGTYLEPDKKYGYANINTTSRALLEMPFYPSLSMLPKRKPRRTPGRILVHLHCFYPDLMPEMSLYFQHLEFPYDIIITTDTKAKKAEIEAALKEHPVPAEHCQIKICPNVGRDVAPFLLACSGEIQKYDFIGHFHTKRSCTVAWGDVWRHYIFDQLLGDRNVVESIFARFEEQPDLGLFFPPVFPVMKYLMHWEENKERAAQLMERMSLHAPLPDNPVFPAGQMFWAKTAAVLPLFNLKLKVRDFEGENGQVQHTLAHVIERIWCYLAFANGYHSLQSLTPRERKQLAPPAKKRLSFFVHYNRENKIDAADVYYLRGLARISDTVVLTNCDLPDTEKAKVSAFTTAIITRDNKGYDFGAWRDGLLQYRKQIQTGYDEVILANNSCYGPLEPFENVFAKMESQEADFWGMSEFPRLENSPRPEAEFFPDRTIQEHLQSIFLVFRRPSLESEVFWNYWEKLPNYTVHQEVVRNCEIPFTGLLRAAGLKSGCYFPAAKPLQLRRSYEPNYNAIYNEPLDYLQLGFPLLKRNIVYCLTLEQLNEVRHAVRTLTDFPIETMDLTPR